MFAYDILNAVTVNVAAAVGTQVVQRTAKRAQRRILALIARRRMVSSLAERVYRRTKPGAAVRGTYTSRPTYSIGSHASEPTPPYVPLEPGFERRPHRSGALRPHKYRPWHPEPYARPEPRQLSTPSQADPHYNPYASQPCAYTLEKQRRRHEQRAARYYPVQTP